MELSLPRGMKDLSPDQAQGKLETIAVIEEIFKRFGFRPLETPAMENSEVISAKKAAGDDAIKEMYTLDDGQTSMRFDLTVPLARYVAMNKDIHMPFKRYQIGHIWRKEEPQKMRYREFTQADIDTVGSREPISDAELIAAAATALDELGIRDCTIYINDRRILEKILESYGVKGPDTNRAIRLIDKIHKIGEEQVAAQLAQTGIDSAKARELVEFISSGQSTAEFAERIAANIKDAKPHIDAVLELISIVEKYSVSSKILLDPSLARGLDYYTSFVWEFVIVDGSGRRLPSVVSGGRYDNLIEVYSKKPIPATGISIGIDRLMEVLQAGTPPAHTYKRVYIAYLDHEDLAYAISFASAARAKGVYADMNSTQRSLAKQLDYANASGVSHVVIIGKNERSASVVRLKRLDTGSEETLGVDEAVAVLATI